jgi:hypothetical protein
VCDPLTIFGLAASAGSTLLGLGNKPPSPPKPVLPPPAPVTNEPSAVVKVGTDKGDPSKVPGLTESDFTERRSAGSPFGNLGRSTLAL